ncbi:hypothetical protein O181_077820 [Austropuccinia psidii MF-1]|uniref:Uncharacterized protein n=1 Tax=Austropuccinia psidii MF-1 TaxID=1389203 RepID=A0A9Q3IGC6_9BASI|nr:hypothetical protein [Austropuccinia psidii MF-1]
MRRNLDMTIEDSEKWLALELSGMNEADGGEIPQKEFKMHLKPPEANSSRIEEDYFNLSHEEMWYISDIENNLMNKKAKYDTIHPLTKRKVE